MLFLSSATAFAAAERVTIWNDGWELVGDLRLPSAAAPVPAVVLLHHAAGDRTIYETLAEELASRGVASLRVDLRGHGESVNKGRFVPGPDADFSLIRDAEADVTAVYRWLRERPEVNGERVGLVGASYSGEEMAEAGRNDGYGKAYVALSPGSFSNASIAGIDTSGLPWLFIVSRDESYLQEITAEVRKKSRTVELVVVPGTPHANGILEDHPDMAERIAVWLARHLRR